MHPSYQTIVQSVQYTRTHPYSLFVQFLGHGFVWSIECFQAFLKAFNFSCFPNLMNYSALPSTGNPVFSFLQKSRYHIVYSSYNNVH